MKATCRKAEESQRAVLERFAALVERAQKQKWTVAKAKALLSDRRRGSDPEPEVRPLPLYELGGKGRARLTVHLDRVRDPATASDAARAELLDLLQALTREIESGPEMKEPVTADA